MIEGNSESCEQILLNVVKGVGHVPIREWLDFSGRSTIIHFVNFGPLRILLH